MVILTTLKLAVAAEFQSTGVDALVFVLFLRVLSGAKCAAAFGLNLCYTYTITRNLRI